MEVLRQFVFMISMINLFGLLWFSSSLSSETLLLIWIIIASNLLISIFINRMDESRYIVWSICVLYFLDVISLLYLTYRDYTILNGPDYPAIGLRILFILVLTALLLVAFSGLRSGNSKTGNRL